MRVFYPAFGGLFGLREQARPSARDEGDIGEGNRRAITEPPWGLPAVLATYSAAGQFRGDGAQQPPGVHCSSSLDTEGVSQKPGIRALSRWWRCDCALGLVDVEL